MTNLEFTLAILQALSHEGFVIAGISFDGFNTGLTLEQIEKYEDELRAEITEPMIGSGTVTATGFELAKKIKRQHFAPWVLTERENGERRWVDSSKQYAASVQAALANRSILIPADAENSLADLKAAAEAELANVPAGTADIETTWTAEEFAAAAQMAAFVNCDGCGKKIPGDAAIEWNSGQQVYCSESCLIRDTAPLIKPQPRTTGPAELEGWTW